MRVSRVSSPLPGGHAEVPGSPLVLTTGVSLLLLLECLHPTLLSYLSAHHTHGPVARPGPRSVLLQACPHALARRILPRGPEAPLTRHGRQSLSSGVPRARLARRCGCAGMPCRGVRELIVCFARALRPRCEDRTSQGSNTSSRVLLPRFFRCLCIVCSVSAAFLLRGALFSPRFQAPGVRCPAVPHHLRVAVAAGGCSVHMVVSRHDPGLRCGLCLCLCCCARAAACTPCSAPAAGRCPGRSLAADCRGGLDLAFCAVGLGKAAPREPQLRCA